MSKRMRSLSSEQLICYNNGKVLRDFFFFFYKQTLSQKKQNFLQVSRGFIFQKHAVLTWIAPVHKVRPGSGVTHWTKSESCNSISQTYDVFEKKSVLHCKKSDWFKTLCQFFAYCNVFCLAWALGLHGICAELEKQRVTWCNKAFWKMLGYALLENKYQHQTFLDSQAFNKLILYL